MRNTLFAIFALAAMTSLGCRETYYNTMEKLGKPRRELLVSRVEKARDSQEETKEQFASALDEFMTVLQVEGGDLEQQYRTLNAQYEKSLASAREVSDRVDNVENVAESLFREWQNELELYTNTQLRKRSEQTLNVTREQYEKLITAMRRAEAKMEPVLQAFQDQVLYLKHNLNAQAIASLRGQLDRVETDVFALIREMEQSIDQANLFIENMGL